VNELLVLIFCVVALILLVVIVQIYNTLVNRRNQVRYAFSCIDVQLKRRFDLIPNLVETVKGYAAHESDLLQAVTAARANVAQPGASWTQEEMLQQQVQLLIARAEAYPDLKANQQFLLLQRQLSECEEQIAAARRAYNASVMDYQNSIGMFPSSIIAALFQFHVMPSFEAAVAERHPVDVKF
jgi:LemA protein